MMMMTMLCWLSWSHQSPGISEPTERWIKFPHTIWLVSIFLSLSHVFCGSVRFWSVAYPRQLPSSSDIMIHDCNKWVFGKRFIYDFMCLLYFYFCIFLPLPHRTAIPRLQLTNINMLLLRFEILEWQLNVIYLFTFFYIVYIDEIPTVYKHHPALICERSMYRSNVMNGIYICMISMQIKPERRVYICR